MTKVVKSQENAKKTPKKQAGKKLFIFSYCFPIFYEFVFFCIFSRCIFHKIKKFFCKLEFFWKHFSSSAKECTPLTISYHLYFLRSLKFGACYITGHWNDFRVKDATLIFRIFFYIPLFFIQKFVFLSFSFIFSDKVSNYRIRVSTNLKSEWW